MGRLKLVALILFSTGILLGQNSLTLSSVTASGSSASLNLTLSSAGTAPAAIQWTLTYSPQAVLSMNVVAGSSAAAAGKSVYCAAGAASYSCILAGVNTNVMSSGVVAVVNVTLASGFGTTTVGVTNVLGATAAGQSMAIGGTGGVITAIVQPTPASLSCLAGALGTGASTTCTVTLTNSSGGTVGLSSNNALLKVPASVSVPSGATYATFTATAGTIPSDQTATITASLNGGVSSVAMSLNAPVTVRSLTCAPGTLNAGGSTTCTVTLSKATGGTVALSSNNAALAVPASISVAAGSTSATFTATAGTFATNQSVTISASLNGGVQTASVALSAPVSVSSLTCAPGTLNAGGSTTCTVIVSKTGGATVTLSSSDASLSVPASVSVAPTSTTATFTATAAAISSDRTAVITASYNGTWQTASVALRASISITSLACLPASLTAFATSACTVVLSKPDGGVVTLSSNNTYLTVPPSVSIASGATTATFTATAGAVPIDQAAVVTASMNGASVTAGIALTVPASVSALSCSPASLASGSTSTCTVTLSKTGGGTVAVSSNNPALLVPATVPVPAGSMAGTFVATAGNISSDQSATVTASLNSSSRTAVISLSAAPSMTSLACSPTVLSTGASSACTITLSKAGGASVTLSSDNVSLTVPPFVQVPPAATAATFTATAGTFAKDQNATVKAALNASVQTATFVLSAPPSVASLSCSPSSLTAGASSTCTVTLSKTGGGSVALSSNLPAVTVPPSVSVPSGSTSATFSATAATVQASTTVTVTASLGGVSQSALIAVQARQNIISALTCSPDPTAAGTLQCTVQLSQAAPAGGMVVALQSNSSRLQPPAQVIVPQAQQSASFAVGVAASDQDAQAQITASAAGAVEVALVSITGIRPTTLRFSSSAASAGQWIDGEVDVNATNIPETAQLALASNTPDVHIPSSIVTRPGQTCAMFRAYIDPAAKQQSAEISVQFGTTTVKTELVVQGAQAPVLNVPGEVTVRAGEEASFSISAVDPDGLPLIYSARNLPAGAVFDVTSGRFSWTPSASQIGLYSVAFTATNSAQAAAVQQVKIAVGSGGPVITGLRSAARTTGPVCSPGALASVEGRWLAPDGPAASAPDGSLTELNGVGVNVNGLPVAVVYASIARIDFVCPALNAGIPLSVTVLNAAGRASAGGNWMEAMSPGLFSLDGTGTGQGIVYLTGTSLLATTRDFSGAGQPAQPGDSISIRVTGIGDPTQAAPIVTVGGLVATVNSVKPIPTAAGITEITVTVPVGIENGDSVPVVAAFPMAAAATGRFGQSRSIRSNTITIAIEP